MKVRAPDNLRKEKENRLQPTYTELVLDICN